MTTINPDTETPQLNMEHMEVLGSLADDNPKEFN